MVSPSLSQWIGPEKITIRYLTEAGPIRFHLPEIWPWNVMLFSAQRERDRMNAWSYPRSVSWINPWVFYQHCPFFISSLFVWEILKLLVFFFFFLQQKITWTKTVAELGLKPVSWLPDLCSFCHTEWQRRCFPRSSQNSGFWVCHTKPYHPKAFSRFREGVSGMCLVPWSLEQLPWGCVWRFPEQQERMVIKSSGTEARLSEFKSILVSTH